MILKPQLLFQDLRIAVRSLGRSKGLAFTVIATLALGIGANAAIFSLVRGVLLRPLVNDDEKRLIYIEQTAKGIGMDEENWSVPEIQDFKSSIHSVSEFGDFSAIGMTMVGLGEPREVQAGVVGGNYFEVVGLHPVLGRLIGPQDDGPKAAGVVVLTYPFWSTVLKKDPSVIGKQVRLESFDPRTATVIGVLEPSIPYPADTAIIANIVTSAHHLSATMVTGRVHRMTDLFGRLAPGVTLDQALAELRSVHASMKKDHPAEYPARDDFRIDARLLRDQITSGARTVLLVLLARYASRFSVRALNLTVDSSVLWVGAILAVIASVLLAYVPHLPTANSSQAPNLASGSIRITGSTNRRLRVFAVVQIAASFVLLAGASMLLKTLIAMQTAETGLDMQHVLAVNVPVMSYQKTPQQVIDFYKETIRRIE